ncbi:MAG: hypothetical protein FJ206_13720 [Gemmatimonadetes bacterium]|nr:hypothetical protein [Gemmatimonadota bacterium]
MLRPTVYIPSRNPCLTEARWRLAQASLEAMVAHAKREAAWEKADRESSEEPPDPALGAELAVPYGRFGEVSRI